jgi:ethanolamine utilization microcompartment shell protein EutS
LLFPLYPLLLVSSSLKGVTQRLCPRCHSVLHLEDDNTLVFCWSCGAPQVRLSQELLEAQSASASAATLPQNPAEPAAGSAALPQLNRWSGAVQCAGLAGAVAAGLTLVSFALPPVLLLSLGWIVSAPIVVLGIYASRFRNTRITAGFAARLGLLCGLAILLSTASLDTVRMCLDRFVFHAATELDTRLAALFAQDAAMLTERFGAADAAPAIAILGIPEFRAGALLCSFALVSGLYLAYSAAAGAFAGLLRSRTPSR